MDPLTSVFTVFVLLLTFVLVTLAAQILRRQSRVRLGLRPIAAYRRIPVHVSEAVESERPIHVSFGGSGLGLESTASAMAVADLLYPLAERAAVAEQPPLVTVADPTALGLAQGTLIRAYRARENLGAFRNAGVRWYPQGPRSLAFAAGVSGAIADEDSNLSVVGGAFGPEIAFIGEMATRYDQAFFAQSDHLDGQAIGWVMSAAPLIGEELYVAGAYLARRPSSLQLGQILAMDGLRALVVLAILLVAAFTFIREWFVQIAIVLGVIVLVTALYYVVATRRQRGRQ
ncbi:MAG: hypothetical protein Kow0077_12430 [Anaerolineae bacterium]